MSWAGLGCLGWGWVGVEVWGGVEWGAATRFGQDSGGGAARDISVYACSQSPHPPPSDGIGTRGGGSLSESAQQICHMRTPSAQTSAANAPCAPTAAASPPPPTLAPGRSSGGREREAHASGSEVVFGFSGAVVQKSEITEPEQSAVGIDECCGNEGQYVVCSSSV